MEFCDPEEPDACVGSDRDCVFDANFILSLCHTRCDPLLQDCEAPFACYLVHAAFVCGYPLHPPDAGHDGDECYLTQDCRPGLMCVNSDVLGDCISDYCCTPFCDVTLGTTDNPLCTDPTEECVPWFPPDETPTGYENVGACAIPP